MSSGLFKEYYKVVNVFWALIGVIYWVHTAGYMPLYAAFVFSLGSFIPFYLLSYLLVNRLQPKAVTKKKMGIFVMQFICITIVMSVVNVCITYFFYYLSENGYFPYSTFFSELNPILKEVLNILPAFFLLNLAFGALRLYYEHTKLQQTHLEVQLKMLQSQVNPHFMFNVLNHIHILIRKDEQMAAYLLEKYSEILRYQLYNSRLQCVPLSKEIQFIKDIISVEKIRWGQELDVTAYWDVEDSWKNIPPQVFAVFVENAFKHASRSKVRNGFIHIVLRQKNSIVDFTIENSKWGASAFVKKETNPASGLGLENIKGRLKILYPASHRLLITDGNEKYKVDLKIVLN